jgi:uncharacterized membrane protein YbhN (UPF0104 family)
MKRIETILFLLGCALFAGLVWSVGPGELWRQLTLLGWGLIPFILAEGASEAIHTVGWRYCLSENLRRLPLFFLFRVRMAGYAINYYTPTAALGGEFTKVSILSTKGRVTEATSGVLIGKVCFALAHLLFVAFGMLLIVQSVHFAALQWVPLLLSALFVTAGIATFFLLQKHGKLGAFLRWLVEKNIGGAPLRKAASALTSVDAQLQAFYRDRPGDMFRAVGWHLFGYSLGIIPTWFFLQAVQPSTSFSAAATIWFLGMCFDLLTFAVPLNAGSLEGSRLLALKFLGYAPGAGMTYGIALRLGQMFWATVGLGCCGTLGVAKQKCAVMPGMASHHRQSGPKEEKLTTTACTTVGQSASSSAPR